MTRCVPVSLSGDDSELPAEERAVLERARALIPPLAEGVDLFFGKGKTEQHYWVIVGSHKDKNEAEAQALAINAKDPSLNAFVGKQMPGNIYYPVIIGDYVPLAEANRLLQTAKQLNAV
jgi:SPOR domain